MISQIYQQAAETFALLGQSRRLEIISLLRDHELSVGQIYSMLDLPQANISQHLMYLRKFQVIQKRRQGKQIFYSLKDKSIIKLIDSVIEEKSGLNSQDSKDFANLYRLTPLVHDPVCGMQVSIRLSPYHAEYLKKTYYFCASGCHHAFYLAPQKYIET